MSRAQSDADAAPESAPPARPSLARRVAGRTTDLLAIAIVLIAGIGMGGTVIDWWTTEPADLSASPSTLARDPVQIPDWHSDGRPISIGLGNFPVTLERQQLAGSASDVRDQLVSQLKQRVESAGGPWPAADEQERVLLSALERNTPALETDSGLRIDHADGPLSMFVGSRLIDDKNTSQRRVVVWGIAFPAGDELWTAYFLHPHGARPSEPLANVEDWLPSGAHRTMSLGTVDGATLLAFEGNGEADAWTGEISRRAAESELTPREDWTGSDRSRRAIFESVQDSRRIRVEVTLSFETSQHIVGLVHVTAGPHAGEEL